MVLLERALLESTISIRWITLLLAGVLVLKNYGRKVILLYISYTADSMECNNDMPSASASEAQPLVN